MGAGKVGHLKDCHHVAQHCYCLTLLLSSMLRFVNWFLIRIHDDMMSRAVAREPRDAAAVVFGLKFADNIHYKFKTK